MKVQENMLCLIIIFFMVCMVGSVSTVYAETNQVEKSPIDQVDLFTGGTGGYAIYRIPGIVATRNGTILAYTEARKERSDWADMDILLRRSLDGGDTWENPHMLVDGASRNITVNNPVMITEKDSDRIHLIYCEEYHAAYYMQSTDEGASWTAPIEITGAFNEFKTRTNDNYEWKVIATGPGHGIELKNGRLLIPIWMANGSSDTEHSPSVVSTIYSDDNGVTWNAGEVVRATDEMPNPNETEAVQLTDGRVMLNMRNTSERRCRAVTISDDGISNWAEPSFDENLVDQVCMGSIIRYSEKEKDGEIMNRILFSNINGAKRTNLTIRLSEDEGKTWIYKRTLYMGSAAYSDLTVDLKKTIYVLFEREEYNYLSLARFNIDWVMEDRPIDFSGKRVMGNKRGFDAWHQLINSWYVKFK